MKSRKEYMKTYRESQKYGSTPEEFDSSIASVLSNLKTAYLIFKKIKAAYRHAKSLQLEEAQTFDNFLTTMQDVYTKHKELTAWVD